MDSKLISTSAQWCVCLSPQAPLVFFLKKDLHNCKKNQNAYFRKLEIELKPVPIDTYAIFIDRVRGHSKINVYNSTCASTYMKNALRVRPPARAKARAHTALTL